MSKLKKFEKKIFSNPEPTDVRFDDFKNYFSNVADSVKKESGDRFVIEMKGHRVVFRIPNDKILSRENVIDVRHLIKVKPGQTLAESVNNPDPKF